MKKLIAFCLEVLIMVCMTALVVYAAGKATHGLGVELYLKSEGSSLPAHVLLIDGSHALKIGSTSHYLKID